VGWFFGDLDTVLAQARLSAAATHGHPEGIAGAQAVAGAVFLARTGAGKNGIANLAAGLGLAPPALAAARLTGSGVLAAESVPQALAAFLAAEDFEAAVRGAVSIGGDTDTVAAMAGAVAEAFFGGVPAALAREALGRLDPALAAVIRRFSRAVGIPLPACP